MNESDLLDDEVGPRVLEHGEVHNPGCALAQQNAFVPLYQLAVDLLRGLFCWLSGVELLDLFVQELLIQLLMLLDRQGHELRQTDSFGFDWFAGDGHYCAELFRHEALTAVDLVQAHRLYGFRLVFGRYRSVIAVRTCLQTLFVRDLHVNSV